MKIKVEDRERNACRIRSKLPFSVAKHRGSETRGGEMSVIHKQAPSRYYLRCLKATFNPKQNKIYVGSNFNAHDVGDKIANYMNSIT